MTSDDTFVVTSNAAVVTAGAGSALKYPSLTFSVDLLKSLLGDPFGSVNVDPARPFPVAREEEEYEPRTALAKRLWSIRKRAIASGEAPASWGEIERELAELRREPADDWD